jgi:hypothetical protein
VNVLSDRNDSILDILMEKKNLKGIEYLSTLNNFEHWDKPDKEGNTPFLR